MLAPGYWRVASWELPASNPARIRQGDQPMGHYRSNVRDLEFALFEVFGRDAVLGRGPYEAVDADTAREMLHEVARLAEHELADSLLDSDRHPPVYDPTAHTVTMPESFQKSYAAYLASGFWAVDVPAELDGTV